MSLTEAALYLAARSRHADMEREQAEDHQLHSQVTSDLNRKMAKAK